MVQGRGKKRSSAPVRTTPRRKQSSAKSYFDSGSSNPDSDDEEFAPATKLRKTRSRQGQSEKDADNGKLVQNCIPQNQKGKSLIQGNDKSALTRSLTPSLVCGPLLSESDSSDDEICIPDTKKIPLQKKAAQSHVHRSKRESELISLATNAKKEVEAVTRHTDLQEDVMNQVEIKLELKELAKASKESKKKTDDIKCGRERENQEQGGLRSKRNTSKRGKSNESIKEDRKKERKKSKKPEIVDNTNIKTSKRRSSSKQAMSDAANIQISIPATFESVQGPSGSNEGRVMSDGVDSDSEEYWEDVNVLEAAVDKSLLESPKKNENKKVDVKDVAVSLKIKSLHQSKSQKNKEKFLQCVERTMRRFQNEVQANLHKAHLVCLVARLLFLNRTCNDQALKALWLSLLPTSMSNAKTAKWQVAELQRFLNWFQMQDTDKIQETLRKLFVAALRAAGLEARLVTSFQPITWKVDNANLFRLASGKESTKEKQLLPKPGSKLSKQNTKHKEKKHEKMDGKGEKVNAHASPYFKNESSDSEIKKDLLETEGIVRKRLAVKSKMSSPVNSKKEVEKKAQSSRKKKSKEPEADRTKRITKKMRARKKIDYEETDVDVDAKISNVDCDNSKEHFDEPQEDSKSDGDDFVKAPKLARKSLASKLSERKERRSCMPSVDRGYAKRLVRTIDNDEEFDRSSRPVKFRKSLNNRADSPTVKVISSDSESCQSKESFDPVNNFLSACDSWCEVYLQSVKKWISIELTSKSVDQPSNCEQAAQQPILYVLGIDSENAIKDVTCRYASKFMSKTRKLRIDREWWAHSLRPYETKDGKRDQLEDTELKVRLLQQPFPTTLGEFKNHPLYVLEGDLLKFEAIYPESPAILGYFRNKAIYSRDCVHVLHTRENWLKEARVVKKGEQAYKVVRGRPKRNTPIHERDKVRIDLFGLWQTEVYKPPPVKNGKVPRNEYGNVELFQPSMLPPGGVHVPIQGIHRTARKLGIDAAPAMMGWDFHGGCAHPVIEGVVVAAEFEEKLLDAWQKDENEREKRQTEKREKKIVERWKLLVKGLLIRDRIRKKYSLTESEDMERLRTGPGDESAEDTSVSWPMNKQEGKASLDEAGHCHIFPDSSLKQDKVTGEWTRRCSCGLSSLSFEQI